MTVKDTIHAKGIEIGIYTTDFENEFISLTDIEGVSMCFLKKIHLFNFI